MPNQELTDITIVLDRSGSMSSIRDDTIGGFNAFLEDQKKQPGSALMTLIQFDHEYLPVHQGIPIASVPPLTAETYVPRGNTALLDAIGRTINDTGSRFGGMAEPDRPGKVIFVILTDGLENASRKFSLARVSEMIKIQTDVYKWTFIYLGANQDAINVAGSMGVVAGNAMTYTGNNVHGVMASSSRRVGALRMFGVDPGYSEKDREEAVKS